VTRPSAAPPLWTIPIVSLGVVEATRLFAMPDSLGFAMGIGTLMLAMVFSSFGERA